jgi:hypothetical protein
MIKLENKLEWESGELSAPSLLTNILNRVGDLLFPPTQNTVDYNSNPQ